LINKIRMQITIARGYGPFKSAVADVNQQDAHAFAFKETSPLITF
jgi:hypothetical protein